MKDNLKANIKDEKKSINIHVIFFVSPYLRDKPEA